MEATHAFSPAISLDNTMDSPSFSPLDDFHTDTSPSPAYDEDVQQHQPTMMQTSLPPLVVHSKPAKKRKSWGQALPEPKTTLPPRKRAKTDDEKEQRRIERIKRNRAAAHNSRERKRQETETLAVALARANAKLQAYHDLHGPLPAHIVLPEVTVSTDAETPAPSLVESHGSQDAASSPASPPPQFTIPNVTTTIKQEPVDVINPYLPPAIESLDIKSSLSPLDLTQHSAAMLCDLPCRSSPASSMTPISPNFFALMVLHLITFQLQMASKTILMALWSHWPSQMVRSMQASMHRLTSRSTTSSMAPLLLRSMAMARFNAATGRPSLQQGALRAPLRTSEDQVARTGMEAAAVRQRQLTYRQRKALGKQSGARPDGMGDENGGA